MLPTYSALVHLATICVHRLHAYLSLGHVPGPHSCFRPTPCSAPLPFVQSRIVEPFPVLQVGVSRVSCEWAPTCSREPPTPSCCG